MTPHNDFFIVSVIIPVYNAEKYLEKAVLSALMQEATGEVILVEDKSPDNALEICYSLQHNYPEKVRVITHPNNENKGAGASRNLGIKNAKYDYIAFLDADDYYLPNRFKKEQEIFKDPSVDGVYAALGVHYYSDRAKQMFLEKGMLEIVTISDNVHPKELIYVLMGVHQKVHGYFHGNSLTVRKQIFDKIGYFNDMRISQDTHMWMRMAMLGKLMAGEIYTPVAVRGVHEENRITRVQNMIKYRIELYESLILWANNYQVEELIIKCLDAYRRFYILSYDNIYVYNIGYLIYSFIVNDFFRRAIIFNKSCKKVFRYNIISNFVIKIKEKLYLTITGSVI